MKIVEHRVGVVVMGLLSLLGCGKPIQEHPGQWFEATTGLPLPAKVEELNTKAIVVLAVGDTYFLKLKTDAEYQALLHSEFSSCSWSDAADYLVPPTNWLNDLSFWDAEEIRKSEHYRRVHVDKGGSRWLTFVAFSVDRGVSYVVGAQTRD